MWDALAVNVAAENPSGTPGKMRGKLLSKMLGKLLGRGGGLRRSAAFGVGLFVMAIGIALTTRSGLGTTPISAPPYVLSMWGAWTLGGYTFAMLAIFVLIQMLLLRRAYQPVQVLQLAAGAVFSIFIDVGMALTEPFVPPEAWQQWLQVLVGCLILGIGVAFQVAPKVTYIPGDGTAVALHQVTGIRFSRTKIAFDSSLMLIAVAFSFVFWGELRGVGFGTIIAAVLVGLVVGWVMPAVRKLLGPLGALPLEVAAVGETGAKD